MEKIFYNGDIITMEDNLYVPAVLIKDQNIVALGTKEALTSQASSDVELIDLDGKTLMPSFIDAHSHFTGVAASFLKVPLGEATSFDDIKEAFCKFMSENNVKPGDWVMGVGYDLNLLNEKTHPTKELLDEIAPNNPALVQHVSNHMGVFNTMALKELGVTIDTPAPEGGMIEQKDGTLTGFMEENAYVYYLKLMPMGSGESLIQSMFKAQAKYASYGITTAQEGMFVDELTDLYKYFVSTEKVNIDIVGYVDIKAADQILPKLSEHVKQYNKHFKIGGYKAFLDGSPSGCTAWLLEPYANSEDGYKGYPIYKDEELEGFLEKAIKDNFQIICHSNGDAACEQFITQYEVAKNKLNSTNEIRPVIIHAALLKKDQLEKAKVLKMIPSFYPANIYYWGDGHIKNFGRERANRFIIAGTANKLGIPFTFHQDSPVIDLNILETIWIVVNRVTRHGEVLGEEEKLDPLDALKAVTIYAAYQYFEEDKKGSIKENKLADLIILDQNPLKVDPMKIRDIKVLETIKEGKTIYKC